MNKRGTITFTFDDGYTKVFEDVPKLLEKYTMRGVFAVALNHEKIEYTEKRPVTPWHEWFKLKDRGHEIASHSVNHFNLTKLSPVELDKELIEPVKKLGATTLVYPGGAFNDAVIEMAGKYYTAARTVVRGLEGLPGDDPLRLKSFNWTRRNFSPGKANLLALWAYLTNSWLIETFHMVDDNDRELVHTVREEDLDRHLRFVAKLPIHVKTIQQVISGSHYEKRGR